MIMIPKAQKHRTTEDKLDLLCINQIEMEKDINCITDECNWIRDAIADIEKSTEEINITLKNMEVWVGEFCKFYCKHMDEQRDKKAKK